VARRRTKGIARVGVITVVAVLAAMITPSVAQGAPSVRGLSGGTITVAGIGIAAQFDPGASIGAQARFKRANDTNEVKGIKIDYKEFADDQQDPAKSLTESRRLVTQVGVFAIVPDLSDTNAGAYLNQQHVPYFGWAFDDTYCSPKPTTALYGFGFNGCLVPAKPKTMPAIGANQMYDIVTKNTGKKNPTLAIFSTDTQAGRDSTGFQASSYAGAGFKVVYSKGEIPPPPVADYTPYVQAVTTSDGGKPPDAMVCLAAIQCIDMWTKIKAGGYAGTFMSALFDPALVGAFGGALMLESGQPPETPTPATKQMQTDVDAIKAGTPIGSAVFAGYVSADFFIQALKKAGANPTPEKVQAAASTMTFQVKGLIGPTKYPDSHVIPTPSCGALVASDGKVVSVAAPYACTTQTYPVQSKFRS
jgi:branched-chain amino acid transport system substrate-binding protein